MALEEIEATMKTLWPSTAGQDKQSKIEFLEAVFATGSWTAVQEKPLRELEDIVKTLKDFETNYKGNPGPVKAVWDRTIMGDIPDFESPEKTQINMFIPCDTLGREVHTKEQCAESCDDKDRLRCKEFATWVKNNSDIKL